jgi:hypothetical protein
LGQGETAVSAAGTCVFCGGTGSLTKSHIWPHWFGRIVTTRATHHEQEIGKFHTFNPQVPGPAYSKRLRQGPAGSRKTRNTCLACNTGWMSTIESKAKPHMVPLIQGERLVLNASGQRRIAALLILIAMRIEFLPGSARVIPQLERDWVRCNQTPTEQWSIWIGHYGGADSEGNWSQTGYAQLEPQATDNVGLQYCNLHVTTMVIGRLCAHLGYSSVTKFPGYDGISLPQLWPSEYFNLDTSSLPSMSEADVLQLHEEFARGSKPMPGGGAPPAR